MFYASCHYFLLFLFFGFVNSQCPTGQCWKTGTGCVSIPDCTTLGDWFYDLNLNVCVPRKACDPVSTVAFPVSEPCQNRRCSCKLGYGYAGVTDNWGFMCFPCSPGYVKMTINDYPCGYAPWGTYASGYGSTAGTPCEINCTFPMGPIPSTQCSGGESYNTRKCGCYPGYYTVGTGCSMCAAGYQSLDYNSSTCTICPVNTYSFQTEWGTNW